MGNANVKSVRPTSDFNINYSEDVDLSSDFIEDSRVRASDGPNCPVCKSRYMNPRKLPCKDTVCFRCLTDHIAKSHTTADGHFVCPVCKQETHPPVSGIPVAEWATLFPLDSVVHPRRGNAYNDNKQSENGNLKVRDMLRIVANRRERDKYGHDTETHIQIPLLIIGAASLPNDDIVLVSQLEKVKEYRVVVSDRSCNPVNEKTFSRYGHEDGVWGICHVEDRKVAISLPVKKRIHILTVGSDIREEKQIDTRLQCFCLANLGASELVTIGFDDKNKKYYRCVIDINVQINSWHSGNEAETHMYEIDGNSKVLYIALNNKKSCMYLSREVDHLVDCYEIKGIKKSFSYTHPDLRSPRGVAVDNKDILYISGYGSNNLHLVTPKGIPICVVTSKIPRSPDVIVFNQAKTNMYLSAGWPYETTAFLIFPALK